VTGRLSPTRTALLALMLGPVIALALLTTLYHTLLAPQPEEPVTAQPVNTLEDAVAAQSTIELAPSAPDTVARPTWIEVPAIDVDAELVPLGLRDDGAMEVPEEGLAGWYQPGPRPGAPGPAVIAAHVDGDSGPDVFFRLRDLRAGDGIAVTDRKGTPHRFVVVDIEQTPKDALPVERIWSDDEGAVLRLITCGGDFDHSSGHYRDNIIVYAEAA
jgi:sortase (surface protein transpeptidase)